MKTATHLKHCFGPGHPTVSAPARTAQQGTNGHGRHGVEEGVQGVHKPLFSRRRQSHRQTSYSSARVFNFLRLNVGRNLFTNGRGKLLLYELLTLFPGRSYQVAISTTTNPYKDWCGVYCENISGVVDLLVEDPALGKGGPKVFGEVKGGSSIYAGLWQLIATMQAAALVSTKWPTGKCE